MPDAKSKAQKRFFGLVRAVQKGQIPAADVTSNVRDAARDASDGDVKSLASTKGDNLPDRINPERMKHTKEALKSYGSSAQEAMVPPSFAEVVREYKSMSETVRNQPRFGEVAERLMQIAEYAEQTLTNEMAEDWYDGHTVQRNVKEMKKYVSEFGKIAKEADQYQQRMGAYYEDMGKILERYFEVYDRHTQEPDTDYQDPNAHSGMARDPYDNRVVEIAKAKLNESALKKFNKLPPKKQVSAAWRII